MRREIDRRTVLRGIAGAAALTGGLATFAGPAFAAHAKGAGAFVRSPASDAYGATKHDGAGARTPFVTIEAESGRLGGGAVVRSIAAGAAVPTVATLELEASGYGLVELKSTGDSVTLVNRTRVSANTLVVRASIPDAPTGGGITARLNLYVDGKFRQAITLDSKQAWLYRNPDGQLSGMWDDPQTGGAPYRFYNEFPVWVTGAPIRPGNSIMLRKDADNSALVYHIDCVDLENVAAPRKQPAGSLSVISYGADPNFGTDSTIAIQKAVDDARAKGKSVWIPAGKYLTNSLAPTPLDFTGVTVNGAGMWYSIIYRAAPLPTPTGWRSKTLVGSGTVLTDIQIDSNAIFRGIGGEGGDDYSILAVGAGGWLIDRVWTRHCDANWLSGTNGIIQNCRTADSYGDGFNVNNSNAADPDKLGHNMTVRNNFARGTGDDGFAVYSDSGTAGTNGQVVNVAVVHNTAVAPWWANGIRVAGGENIRVLNNWVDSASSNNAMDIGVFGDTGHPLVSCTVRGNVLLRGGGWNGIRYGVHIGSPSATSHFPTAYTNAMLEDNVISGALRSGLFIDKMYERVTIKNNRIENPADGGIQIASGVTGTGSFVGNTVRGLSSDQEPYQNNSESTFVATLNGNSWQRAGHS